MDRWDQRCVKAALHLVFHKPYNKNPSIYDNLGLNALEVKHLPTSLLGCNESIAAIPALDTSRLIGISGGSTRLQIYTKGTVAFDILRVVTSKKSEHLNSKRTYASAEDSATQTIALKYLQGLPVSLPREGRHRFRSNDATHQALLQETVVFNALLKVMRESLYLLCNAYLGKVTMTEEHEGMAADLLTGVIPALWQKQSFPSTKNLAAWFSELKMRVEYISHLKDLGFQPVVALPVFYFPRAYLWTVAQNYGRKHFLPLDKISFQFKIISLDCHLLDKAPEEGIFIVGFVLEGACWDRESEILQELPSSETVSQAPVLNLFPSTDFRINKSNYVCPLYQTLKRRPSDFVAAVEFPTCDEQVKWTLQGTALILDCDADGVSIKASKD